MTKITARILFRPSHSPCLTPCPASCCSAHPFAGIDGSGLNTDVAQESELTTFEEGIIDQQKMLDEDAVIKLEQDEIEHAKKNNVKKPVVFKLVATVASKTSAHKGPIITLLLGLSSYHCSHFHRDAGPCVAASVLHTHCLPRLVAHDPAPPCIVPWRRL